MEDKKNKNVKKVFKILIPVFCIAVLAVIMIQIFSRDTRYIEAVEQTKVDQAYQLLSGSLEGSQMLYIDWLEGVSLQNTAGGTAASAFPLAADEAELDYLEAAEYEVTVPEAGYYHLKLEYRPEGSSLTDYNAEILINDEQPYFEMKNIALPLYWMDETKDFPTDRYGDETASYQIKQTEWASIYLYNGSYYTAEPLLFYFQEGINQVKLINVANNGLVVGKLELAVPDRTALTYSEYSSAHAGSALTDSSMISINAVDYSLKNTTNAVLSSVDNPALKPHQVEYKKLNVLTWTTAGAEISYEFDVPRTGLYKIALHYQNSKEDFSVFQTIRLDGMVPFWELVNYEFKTTDTSWANETLGKDGEPFLFYLTEGQHVFSIKAEQEPIMKAWRYARLVSEHITQFDLAIKKITGPVKDENRTWDMTKYIPEIPDYLDAYEVILDYIIYSLQEYAPNGAGSAVFSDLNKVKSLLEMMREYPDEIALYVESLSGRDNSVIVSMGNFLTKLYGQKFALDMIYVYGDEKLPKENTGLFKGLANNAAGLINTFTSDKFKRKETPDELTIWVNRAMTHTDLLQKMVDTEFTPATGIHVNISVMPDANKLTMAVASNDTPDMALGLASNLPFELSSRGALYDLTQFPDFWEIAGRFPAGAFTAYLYNEKMYALPETMTFHAMVYRKDIFNSLGLTVPSTWTDVRDMLPHLQRLGMNFYHNISAGVGYKWFYQTAAQIFQNNGKLYTEDGLHTAIDQTNAVKGIKELADLFITYSLDKQVISFFNSFRYGTLPIGIVSLEDYILIKDGAPELADQWELALYPGTEQADGSIARWYVANGTSGIIFKDTEHADDAWEFLKWWTSHSVQVNYAHTLQSTYGKTFVWLSANLDAIRDSTFPQKEKTIIMEQVNWVRDVPRTPGQYLVERAISDIWNTMISDGKPAQVAVDEKVMEINREIDKKMRELGYYDAEGRLIQRYVIHDYDWIAEKIAQAGKEGN